MHDINLIPEVQSPRFLNDPDEFLIGVTTDVIIFSDGYYDYTLPSEQEVYVCTQELENRATSTLRIYLARNYRFTATIDFRSVEPA